MKRALSTLVRMRGHDLVLASLAVWSADAVPMPLATPPAELDVAGGFVVGAILSVTPPESWSRRDGRAMPGCVRRWSAEDR